MFQQITCAQNHRTLFEILLQHFVFDSQDDGLFNLVYACATRDLILWMFLQNDVVSENDILKYTKVAYNII
ncbi:hypothetical protein HZS_670 [Henneguya salminicola]|nr:hypothetical protein HZS_670 [Henneguya salminicola]